jgi:hypothetical protein
LFHNEIHDVLVELLPESMLEKPL